MEIKTNDKESLTAVQKLPKYDSEVLQYVSRLLRVWVQDEQQKTIRPYYHFLVRLYPKGQVIRYEICRNPDIKPTASQVFDFLCRTLLDPPTGEDAHRPGIISFTDQDLETQLANMLNTLGIETQVLQPAEGLEDLVKAVSESLIKRDLATRTDASERPGMLSKPGVDLSMIQACFTAAYRLREKGPWSEFSENQVYGIRIDDIFRFVVVLGSSGNVFGVAVCSSLSRFRQKYCQAMGSQYSGSSSSNISCAFCGAEQLLVTYRCTQCKVAYYCNEKCQRKDWSVHKQECYNNALWNQKLERPFLQRKEMTVIYCSETAVPFDDLDLQAKYSWPLYPCEENFPVAFVVVVNDGETSLDRPNKEELQWLTKLCEVLVESCGKTPSSLNEKALMEQNKWIFVETLSNHK